MAETEQDKTIASLRARVEYLEEQSRFTLGILETAATLGDFPTSLNRLEDPALILELTAERVRRILPLSSLAIYLVNEQTSDFDLVLVQPQEAGTGISRAVDFYIEKGLFSWALKERRPVFLASPEGEGEYLLHVLATTSRVRGMIVGAMAQDTSRVYDTSLALLSVLMLHCANAMESFELYRLVRDSNQELERKVAERTSELEVTVDKLTRALNERNLLLSEIHHRVKNNLQIISSLLSLQGRHIEDETVRGYLRESRARIRSMAMVHEILYRSENFSRISLRDYLGLLTGEMMASYRTSGERVSLELDLDETPLSTELAVPCGMIVTELFSNCLKHAFPGERRGRVRIEFSRSGEDCLLKVADDGVGLPEGMDTSMLDSLGLKLVEVLTSQIDGTVEVDTAAGTSVAIAFSCPDERPASEG